MKPAIAVSCGDPCGVGPEVVLKALADGGLASAARWLLVASPEVWAPVEKLTGIELTSLANVELVASDAPLPSPFAFGQVDGTAGAASLRYIEQATRLCLEGRAAAMVTAPVSKEAVSLCGRHFTGHTEYIAELCGTPDTRMLLYNERVSVVHVSTHCSLREACNLDTSRIIRTIRLGHEAMARLGLARPRLAVCGLNPHAGENGLFGSEDAEFIAPAVEAARKEGIDCYGPLPADTLFMKASRGAYDLVVAMYHDQGHAPMKLLDFENTVNVSLGLPIIRTSVDHGTAFDIAGKNLADPTSLKAAMRLALRLAAGAGAN
jgi:4-phospho-D-threonate 3-dehydrogenase / 4-phospho-D-erythronate 3-dehydrogenase